MKTLILVRHAKSSWEESGLSDHDRPLNDRGKKDAPEMAKRVQEKIGQIDVFLSSTAKRARRTARVFAEAYGKEKKDLLLDEKLYMATHDGFLSSIEQLEDQYESAAVFSHNPGITEFASSLTNVRIDDMPTCAVFAIVADVSSWKEFSSAEKKFLFFDYPKNPLD